MAKESKALDVAALIVSILAFLASLGSPFIVYHYLQNDVRIQRLKAKALRASALVHPLPKEKLDGTKTILWRVEITIAQEGEIPVGGVEAIAEAWEPASRDFFKDAELQILPHYKATVENSGDKIAVFFENAIPPGERVTLVIHKEVAVKDFSTSPDFQAWVRSEASPAIPLLNASGVGSSGW
jgi:hypothetical protein